MPFFVVVASSSSTFMFLRMNAVDEGVLEPFDMISSLSSSQVDDISSVAALILSLSAKQGWSGCWLLQFCQISDFAQISVSVRSVRSM